MDHMPDYSNNLIFSLELHQWLKTKAVSGARGLGVGLNEYIGKEQFQACQLHPTYISNYANPKALLRACFPFSTNFHSLCMLFFI